MKNTVLCFIIVLAFFSLYTLARAIQPTQILVQFKKGEIQFKQGGKEYLWTLKSGKLESMKFNVGGKPMEIRSIHLIYVSSDKKENCLFALTDVLNPGKYGKDHVGSFSVVTAVGYSYFNIKKSDCQITILQLDRRRVGGTIVFTGEMDDGKGGKGLPITELKFSATP